MSCPPVTDDAAAASLRVLGIALVVDQLGKGPRMVLRYPSSSGGGDSRGSHSRRSSHNHGGTNSRSKQPPSSLNSSIGSSSSNNTSSDIKNSTKTLKGSMSNPNHRNDTSTTITKSDHDDLFFKLSGRQISKLFRPKPSLCGQPITLTIDHTYFCCCAVLMNHQNNSTSTSTSTSTSSNSADNPTATTPDGNDIDSKKNTSSTIPVDASTSATTTSPQGKDQQLVLFSVVVAVAPTTASSPSQLSPTQRFTESNDDILMSRYNNNHNHNYNNPIFPCIRRVHIALARICRVLEREERRCHYVSCQILLYEQIRSELTSSSSSTTATSSSVDKGKPTTKVLKHATTSITSNTVPKESIISTTTAATTTTMTTNATSASSTITSQSSNTDTSIGSASFMINNASNAAVITTATTTAHRRSGSLNASPLDMSAVASLLPSPLTPNAATTEMTKPDLLSSSISQSQQSPYVSSFETTIQHEFDELEQILLETFMTAPSTRYVTHDDVEIQHAGNLAQELAQVYHALAATHDHIVSPTLQQSTSASTESVLSGRDSVVYMNGHLAVPIEAAVFTTTTANNSSMWQEFNRNPSNDRFRISAASDTPFIRPYMTLLFPNTTADQILDALHIPIYDGTTSLQHQQQQPRRIQQILRVWSSQKSLSDMAEEAYLPIETVLEVAKQLVRQGLCIVSPILSYSVSFVCPNIQRIQQMTLPFFQKFGIPNIHLFVLVSYLTESNRTFGMSIAQLVRYTNSNNYNNNSASTNDDDPINTHVRIPIVRAIISRISSNSSLYDNNNSSNDDANIIQSRPIDNLHQTAFEDIIYQMIVWLCSLQVIVPIQEYLVLMHPNPNIMIPSSLLSSSQEQPLGMASTLAGNNTHSSSVPIEERKYDDMMKVSSVATTKAGSMSTTVEHINNNNKNDEYIWQTIFNHFFSHAEHSKPESQKEPYHNHHHQHHHTNTNNMILLLECSYRTGIEERILKSFVSRHSNQFRIVAAQQSSPPLF